jgi:hypothetical protein
MARITLETLKQEFKALTGRNLQLQGGIYNCRECEWSLAYSVKGVKFYDDDILRGRYTLKGLSGDQNLEDAANKKLLSPGRKIVLVERVDRGVYVIHGVYEYRGRLEVLYHPGKDGVERKMYRAVLNKIQKTDS